MYLDLVGAASKNVHYMGEVNPEGFTNPRTSEKKKRSCVTIFSAALVGWRIRSCSPTNGPFDSTSLCLSEPYAWAHGTAQQCY